MTEFIYNNIEFRQGKQICLSPFGTSEYDE